MVYRILYGVVGMHWNHLQAPDACLKAMQIICLRPTSAGLIKALDDLTCDHYFTIEETFDNWRVYVVFSHDKDAIMFKITHADLLNERATFFGSNSASFQEVDPNDHVVPIGLLKSLLSPYPKNLSHER